MSIWLFSARPSFMATALAPYFVNALKCNLALLSNTSLESPRD